MILYQLPETQSDPPSYVHTLDNSYQPVFSSTNNDFPTTTGVVIGFKDPEVQVIENITEVKLLCLEVLDGKLMRTTVVSVTYQDRSAISKYKTEEEFVDWLMGLSKIINYT